MTTHFFSTNDNVTYNTYNSGNEKPTRRRKSVANKEDCTIGAIGTFTRIGRTVGGRN
jgi:hypothetical protein